MESSNVNIVKVVFGTRLSAALKFYMDTTQLKIQAEIKIAREFKQGCRSCNKETGPVFDQEATDIAMSKAIEIIKKVMYNLTAPANVSSEPHSQARDRKNPHDSSRCEACRARVCCENVIRTVSSGQSRVFDDRYHGMQTKKGGLYLLEIILLQKFRFLMQTLCEKVLCDTHREKVLNGAVCERDRLGLVWEKLRRGQFREKA